MSTTSKPGDAEAKLDLFGLEAVCDEILSGNTRSAICKKLGITRASLIRWIALDSERQARVREAHIDAAQAYDEMAEEALKSARGKDALARARDLAHHYRWRASKANPREYGEKLQVDQTTTVVNLSDEEIDRRRADIKAKLAAAEQAASGAAPAA